MKRISLLLASLTLGVASTASALVGGPFDNGDYSALLDNSGVYQAAFRFENGSGFAQFGTNVDIATFVDINSTGGTGLRGSTFSYLNRSIIYYKGVTYLGTAFGTVDHASKRIEGVTNGNSDVRTNSQSGGNNQNNSQSLAAATTSLLNNGGVGFPCNTRWRAKITATKPIVRFSGTGELTVINPSLDQVAYAAIVALLTGSQNASTSGQTLSVAAQMQQLINAVTDPNASSVIPSADKIADTSDVVPMTVFGSRQFFVGRR